MLKHQARWYVYQLIDPRDHKPFYVGKGSGIRIDAHEKEMLKGVCSRKCFRIKEIVSSGKNLIKEKVAYFWDEQAAYDYETDLIDEIGLENLTNVLRGGQKAWQRRKQEKANRLNQKQKSWVDIILPYAYGISLWIKNPDMYKKSLLFKYKIPAQQRMTEIFREAASDIFTVAIKECLEENKQRTINMFSDYGITQCQLEKIAA